MTNNPRNPLPGEEPGSPQDPGQPISGQPQDPGSTRPASGSSRSTSGPASGATPVSSSQERTGYTEPRVQQATSQTSQPVQRSQPTTTRTQQPPRRSNNKKIALFSILGLAAVAGIITGFAASNSTSAPTAAVHRTVVRHAPAAAPSTRGVRILTTLNGSGSRTSAPFTVTNPSAAHWGFNCASGTHSFSASMATTSGGNRIPITSTSGTRNTGTMIMHPTSTGTPYRITANSACPYSIRIYGT
jgi:hypothetical protein